MGKMPNETNRLNNSLVKRVLPFYFIFFGCGIASVAMSLLVRSIVGAVLPFCAALGTFILRIVMEKRLKRRVVIDLRLAKNRRLEKLGETTAQ